MKRHLHLAMGLSSVLLAACCLAGAGLAWLRAAVGAVARTALVCAAAEPAQIPEEILTMTGTTETAVSSTVYWFGATLRVDEQPDTAVRMPGGALDTAAWSLAPPGFARAGPGPVSVTGTRT